MLAIVRVHEHAAILHRRGCLRGDRTLSSKIRLDAEWLISGRDHAGIVVSSQRTIGDTLHRLAHLARSLHGEDFKNRLEYLGDW